MLATRNKSDSLMDQVFAAVTLPTVGETTIVEERHEESRTVHHHESHHVESHTEHFEYTSSGITVGNVVGHQIERRPTVDTEDQRSEVSALSKATSVSVHSSVSQQSAQHGHYDLPPIPQYDMPPIVVGEAVVGKAPSTASSKSGSRHSVASHHSHHSQHSHHSALTHDSESTITEGTLVNQPITVGGVVGGIAVGGVIGSEAPTPLAVGQSFEHDAVIEQFKNLHGKEESVVSSIVPASVHLHSDSEDSIAPSKLTHSIAVGGVVGNGYDVLHKSHELEYTDFSAPAYYQPPSVQGGFDARSEDSFGFEKVEYVDTVEHHYTPEEHVEHVVHEHVIEQPTYEPYHIVHENHQVPSVDFDEDRHSEHHHHDHHHHHDSHVTHTYTSDVKQSRSNSASTYQSRQIYAHNVGPKITEELRPAAVIEEEEVEVKPPVMAYVAPIPIKPPRTHEESHVYNAYETEIHHQKEIVKSTTIVQEDVRIGSEGVSALRRKFEHGAPPPMAPVLDLKKHEHQEHHHHHHHHHHQDVVVVEQVQTQVGENTISSSSSSVENHYDIPFESREKTSSSSISSSYQHPKVIEHQHVYDTPVIENFSHSPAFYTDDQRHHYVPQIKVITEYRHINPRHHYVETRIKKADGHEIAQSPQVQSIDYFKEIEHVHHFVPSTPTSPLKEVRHPFHHHNYVPNSLETKRESRSVERTHHYLPDTPVKLDEHREIIRQHQYVPLEKRSQSSDSKVVVHHEHQYVPLVKKQTEDHQQHVNRHHQYVPLEKKSEVVKNVAHEHHYIPLSQKTENISTHVSHEHQYIPLKTEHTEKKVEVEWHNQYIPLTTQKEIKSFDSGRSHSYIPLGGNIEHSKKDILREHNFVPLVEKKNQTATAINQRHNYVPAHSNVAISDKVSISREHGFVPLANKTEAPRHSNDLSHHQYMPLPAKRNMEKTATGDKVGHEHHYYPLAPKTEQVAIHGGQEHHYVPLATKSTESHVSKAATSQHQYIPLTMQHNSIPRLPREHNYIPLTGHAESNEKVNLANHQYLPPVSHVEKKEAVKLYEHQYVPLPPKQDTYVVRKIEGKEHHYVPFVQNYAAKPPQLPREHHYYPLAVRAEEHQKHAHDHHNYIPPVHHQQHVKSTSDHQHGYVPVAKKQEQKKEILYEHQYIPPIRKNEQINGYERTHHYVPVGQNVKHTEPQLPHDHHYVPQASPRKHVSEKVSEHVQLGGSRKSTLQSGHHHHHHHHHENHNDVPSRPSSVASSIKQPQRSRNTTVSTVRGAPVQRVTPTVQHHVVHNPYGDHQSVRVVKNVREFVNVFGATHVVPPPTPLAGVPRLPPRSPISHETFEPHCDSVKSSRKSSVVSIGKGVHLDNAARKSTCSSATSSRKSSVVSNGQTPILVGGNVVCPAPRSRNATLTQENVHDHYDGEHTDLIHVADMRKLFENYGPAHLPEYASSPYAYIH